MNYVMTDKWYSIHCCGTLSTWTLFVAIPGTIHLQVWKRDYTTGEYVLKGENTFIYSAGRYNNQSFTKPVKQIRKKIKVKQPAPRPPIHLLHRIKSILCYEEEGPVSYE